MIIQQSKLIQKSLLITFHKYLNVVTVKKKCIFILQT